MPGLGVQLQEKSRGEASNGVQGCSLPLAREPCLPQGIHGAFGIHHCLKAGHGLIFNFPYPQLVTVRL